jgi:nucleoside-diphosphate-sugar epimerase
MTDPRDRLCLVTGGAGFIGSNLVGALLSTGSQVRVLDDLSTGRPENLEGTAVDLVVGDVRDAQTVGAAVAGVSFVFHLAAIPSVARSVADPVASNEVNVAGTLNVLVAARDAGCEGVVFASSSAVYGEQTEFPLHEGMVCRPISPYGVTKLAGERYMTAFAASFELPTVSLRFFNVFGPRQNPNAEYAAVVPRFMRAALQHEPVTIFGDGQQARDFVFVGDVVNACLLSGTYLGSGAQPGGALNVATGARHTVNQLASTIAGLTVGEQPEPVHAPGRPGDVRESYGNVAAAGSALGYVPKHSFEEGLSLTMEWFGSQLDV